MFSVVTSCCPFSFRFVLIFLRAFLFLFLEDYSLFYMSTVLFCRYCECVAASLSICCDEIIIHSDTRCYATSGHPNHPARKLEPSSLLLHTLVSFGFLAYPHTLPQTPLMPVVIRAATETVHRCTSSRYCWTTCTPSLSTCLLPKWLICSVSPLDTRYCRKPTTVSSLFFIINRGNGRYVHNHH